MAEAHFSRNPAEEDSLAEPIEERAPSNAIKKEPWRNSSAQEPVGEGITYHEGPEQIFGLHVSPDLNQKIDPAWREPNGWYEGVNKWPVVAIAFPDRFEDNDVKIAHVSAKTNYPDAYQEFTSKMFAQPDQALGYSKINNYHGEGISLFETPIETHLHVSQELNEKIDPAWRQPDGRYDADNQSSIVALSFPERFDPSELAAARQDAKDRYPDIYGKVIGRMPPPAMNDDDNLTNSPETSVSKPAPNLKNLIAAFDRDPEPAGKAADEDAVPGSKEPAPEPEDPEKQDNDRTAANPETEKAEKPVVEDARADTKPAPVPTDTAEKRLFSADKNQTPSTAQNSNPAATKIDNPATSTQSRPLQGRQNDQQQNYDHTQQPVTAPIALAVAVASSLASALRRNPQENRRTPQEAEPAAREPARSPAQPPQNASSAKTDSVAPTELASKTNAAAYGPSNPVGGSLALRNLLTGFRPERSESIAPREAGPLASDNSPAARVLLEKFDRSRMQPRRDADQLQATERAAATAVSSFGALERADFSAILTRIREAAEAAPGGMKEVLSEMKPGGAYEDLRKEFNAALARDEHFSAAYENASSTLDAYADQREKAAPILQKGNSGFLARLEALDRQIVKASADVPGKEAGKSVLDEALEKGREALTQAIDAVRSAFSRQGPSAGPSISP
jgi:hypothetical protein